MRLSILLFTSLLYTEMCVGPPIESAISANGAGGYYDMTALIDIVQGRTIPIDAAFAKHGIFIKKMTVGDEGFDSSFLNKKYYYQIQYFDLNREKTSSLKAAYISVEYDKKHFQERQWLAINDSTGFLVVFEQSAKKGVVTRLMISNVMQSPSYRAELDTIRYIYRPKFN